MVKTYVINDYDIATVLFLFVGVVLFSVGVPLLMEIVKPNWVYGCRTKKTLSNEVLWYKVNRRGGRNFMLAGLITSFASTMLYVLRPALSGDAYTLVLMAVMVVAMGVALADTLRYEHREWKQLAAVATS